LAQNYRCVNPNRIALFEKKNGYLTALRIDSVAAEGDDTIYYPMHNIREFDDWCLTPEGSSWIGEKIVIKSNGEWHFFNNGMDTIVIHTKAIQGDRWKMYSDENLIVEAEVILIGKINFLGISDTIKNIVLDVYDSNHNIINDHPISNMGIWLSKNYGLTKTPNFYFIPDHQEYFLYESLEEYELAGLDNPELGSQNITWKMVHNYDVGDELHVVFTDWYTGYSKGICSIKKLISKDEQNDTSFYYFERWEIKSEYHESTGGPFYTYKHDTAVSVVVADSIFDKLPGEVVLDEYQAYTHRMTDETKIVPSENDGILWPDGEECWTEPVSDDCDPTYRYLRGLGGPYYHCYYVFEIGEMERKLVYYKKGNIEWGTPLTITSVESASQNTYDINIYPNPAEDILTIDLEFTGENTTYEIFDCIGKSVLLQGEIRSNSNTINISQLPSGLYLISIVGDAGIIRTLLFSKN